MGIDVVRRTPKNYPTTGQHIGRLGSEFLQAISGRQERQLLQQKQQAFADRVRELTGKDVSGLPPEAQMEFLKISEQARNQKELQGLKGQQDLLENQQKQQEKLAPFESGLQTIEQMRNLRKRGNIGWGSKATGIYNSDARKDRAEYETLGNSLISLASNIPIRNKAEFETLTGKLNDPGLTLAEIDGVLDAMERIIIQNMQGVQGKSTVQDKQNRPSLDQFRIG